MAMNHTYANIEPARETIDALPDATVIEFGAPWCPHCLRAQPLLSDAFDAHPGLRHIKIEDGPRRRLGRSFRIKLWPTLVFMKDGVEVSRLVRPDSASDIAHAMSAIDG
ncbi:thioredoxin family protein [Oxalicibacterium solurbis]|uniref:Thiol reductase thioredoxin n=1 Tax=Oxalicibacterium solurbis TaxID=69280 RepID=A0A8J3AV09_9BURK|nr:thioredoxin family protein [Oxalicibacterium solurbis]GGI53725.1 thiol reductase thioredoxin [Oxalicibacterium solurbis]